jgi:methylmalonyl-CoA/ethylmalonyl-CoA epimerase
MQKKIEHLGIAVKNLKESEKIFQDILGVEAYKKETVESEFVNTLFFKVGESKIELLEPTSEQSAIHKFIEKKGEGIHHIAFDVADIHLEMNRLKDLGYTLLNEVPKKGADNKLICFLHPKSSNGVLIELCQEINE